MSGFNKKGYKQSQQRFVKFHSKGVNIILEQLDNIYRRLAVRDVNEENIGRLASDLMGRELDSMELNILKGKFGFDESEDNNK